MVIRTFFVRLFWKIDYNGRVLCAVYLPLGYYFGVWVVDYNRGRIYLSSRYYRF